MSFYSTEKKCEHKTVEKSNETGTLPFQQKASRHMGWLALFFLLLAIGFIFNGWGNVRPVIENPSIDGSFFSHPNVRDPALKPELKKIGFTYQCNSCHQHFSLPDERAGRVAEHTDIVLQHGENSRCLNCHNAENWETLKDYEGVTIAFEHSQDLCRKCTGPSLGIGPRECMVDPGVIGTRVWEIQKERPACNAMILTHQLFKLYHLPRRPKKSE